MRSVTLAFTPRGGGDGFCERFSVGFALGGKEGRGASLIDCVAFMPWRERFAREECVFLVCLGPQQTKPVVIDAPRARGREGGKERKREFHEKDMHLPNSPRALSCDLWRR